ncbi:unnamed protein product [Dibothriocephalus latus]|uniref:Uncharacterized protein n=1 Tax=Dibothriocephalus latus TaxID=60516 RepID=A0A3P7NSQ1_DIBLA|nr:unnamed protein product [Dibothriocephalus latus]
MGRPVVFWPFEPSFSPVVCTQWASLESLSCSTVFGDSRFDSGFATLSSEVSNTDPAGAVASDQSYVRTNTSEVEELVALYGDVSNPEFEQLGE